MMQIEKYSIRIVVYGSRSFNNYEYFDKIIKAFIKQFHNQYKDIAFITGAAWSGPDRMIIKWCECNNYPYFEFPAEWDKYGKKAGYLRNITMSENGNYSIGLWDGVSRGTKHMNECCYKNIENLALILLVDKFI